MADFNSNQFKYFRLIVNERNHLLEACKQAYEMLERATGVEHDVLETLRAAIKLAKR